MRDRSAKSKIKKETSLYSKRPSLTTATGNGVVIGGNNDNAGVVPQRANPTKADVSFSDNIISTNEKHDNIKRTALIYSISAVYLG